MRKTSVAIDEILVARTSALLGTRSLCETIQHSREEVVAQDLSQRHLHRLKLSEFAELADANVMAEAWR